MFQFSIHSLEQLVKRKLTEENILWVIETSMNKTIEEDLTIYQNIILENEKKYLVRVFVNENKVPPLIITAYKTSNIKKYKHEN